MINCGIDILKNERFLKLVENPKFLEKVFHARELKDKKKLATIFTIKEATMKALGRKVNWKDIEIKYDKNDKPMIKLSENIKPEKLISIDGSVSHDVDYTIGFVILEIK